MERFIARQPIFDRKQKIFGYELLFRSGLENYFDCPDFDEASSRVIADSFLLFSIDEMTDGTRAFINMTRNILVKDYTTVLPRQTVVAEILETIDPDEDLIGACRRLKNAGFTVALDDFVYRRAYEPVFEYVDIIKVDFLATPLPRCGELAEALAPRGIKLVAEKVETQEVFQQALGMGYDYFQGYFFSRPVIVSRRDIPASKLHYLRILREINSPEMDFRQLEQTIHGEVSVSYKLLKYINSAAFGLRRRVTSIGQALALLGENEIRKWASLLALTNLALDKPDALVACAQVRAKLCELLAPAAGLQARTAECFLMGLFSLLDAILDRPMPQILAEIPMEEDIRRALLGESNPLRQLLDLVVSIERGDWALMEELATGLGLAKTPLQECFMTAIRWVRQTSRI
ncbi:hypothetical protein DESUT3_32820 [Desulfuromonas versatilis]|uniref:Diguanylate phosphodiesterase n=1 Tax=Desulfuromonas versatilis TaxID=2802975 RepID=A0ABM8HZK2_9BACT|nr:HDOD domain-containing protein [Desulfuromonas versatilis]BCR06213.1 hypothetical protein DESUT3_32820 [Desulfuromonas versatilis]